VKIAYNLFILKQFGFILYFLIKLFFQKESNASIAGICYATLFFLVSSPNKKYGVLFLYLFLIEENTVFQCVEMVEHTHMKL